MKKILVILTLFCSISISAQTKNKIVNTLPPFYDGKWYVEAVKDFYADGTSTPAARVKHILLCEVDGNKVALADEREQPRSIAVAQTEIINGVERFNVCFKGINPNEQYWTVFKSILPDDVNIIILEIYNNNRRTSAFLITVEKIK